jgi:tetratricopeptide (TPR) repeat protein
MRILHVGNPVVVAPLRALGHEVLVAFESHPDLAIPGRPFDARELWRRLPTAPDVLLVVDTLGRQTLAYGIEELPVCRIYYAIDIHLNFFWQRHYGRLFDLVLVAQKDYVPLFESAGVPAYWLPSAVDGVTFRDLGLPRIYDISFVGIVDPVTRPKRAAAIEILRQRFGLMVFGVTPAERLSATEMARVFSASKIVFNESVMGDVNFRVFEAMACGALLLTERIDNGFLDLFTPGEHLDIYTPDSLVDKVAYYLDAHQERARIAARGAAEVRARHTLGVRMAELGALIATGVPRRDVAPGAAFHWGMAAHLTVVRGLTDPKIGLRMAAEALRAAVIECGEAEAAVALAEVMAWAGRHDGALVSLAEARRLDPTNVRAWFVAGEIARLCGRATEAAALFRAGVRAVPCVAPATRVQALAAIDAGIETSASLHALGLVMQEAGLPFLAGLVRHVDGDLPRMALDYYTRAVEADPTNRAAAESAAALLEFMNLPDFAAQFHELIVRAAPGDVEARERLCGILARSFQFPALRHQRRVIAALGGGEPDDGNREEQARAYHEAGVALRQQGAVADAVAALDRAAQCWPAGVETVADAALARIDAGDYAGAGTWLERALGIVGSEGQTVSASERGAIEALLALVRQAGADAPRA